MNRYYQATRRPALLFSLFLFSLANIQNSENAASGDKQTGWLVAGLLRQQSMDVRIGGEPRLADSPYGEAVYFDGVSDALFLEEMPLKSLREFTVEMVFYPDTASPFEQRVLHIGEVNDDRMLLEIRAVNNNWYLDGYVASGENKRALIDENLTHPLGQWHHVAFVVGPESLTTFVNGKKELSEPFSFLPINTGHSSIGVRQNERSWFKGMIYLIRITSRRLNPKEFMAHKSASLR